MLSYLGILSHDILITIGYLWGGMHRHALETAVALYGTETYTVSMAAQQAGVDETRLADCLARRGIDTGEHRSEDVAAADRATAD